MGIINEYEEILIGNRKKISSNYFLFDKKGNERVALSVIRYAIENLLGWDVHNAIKLFNSNYISFMKLDQMVKYIYFQVMSQKMILSISCISYTRNM